jgi:transposase InsO family protein
VVESFFGTLKSEWVHWRSNQTREEAKADIVMYIRIFYNSRRLHSHGKSVLSDFRNRT